MRVKKGADVISDRNTCITSHMTDRKPNGKTSEPSINNVTCTSANHLNQWRCRVTVEVLLYVHKNHQAYLGRGDQDGHLDFHTAPELCEMSRDFHSFVFTLFFGDL